MCCGFVVDGPWEPQEEERLVAAVKKACHLPGKTSPTTTTATTTSTSTTTTSTTTTTTILQLPPSLDMFLLLPLPS